MFTSTETRRLIRTDSPGRPPRLSHSSWTMTVQHHAVQNFNQNTHSHAHSTFSFSVQLPALHTIHSTTVTLTVCCSVGTPSYSHGMVLTYQCDIRLCTNAKSKTRNVSTRLVSTRTNSSNLVIKLSKITKMSASKAWNKHWQFGQNKSVGTTSVN